MEEYSRRSKSIVERSPQRQKRDDPRYVLLAWASLEPFRQDIQDFLSTLKVNYYDVRTRTLTFGMEGMVPFPIAFCECLCNLQ